MVLRGVSGEPESNSIDHETHEIHERKTWATTGVMWLASGCLSCVSCISWSTALGVEVIQRFGMRCYARVPRPSAGDSGFLATHTMETPTGRSTYRISQASTASSQTNSLEMGPGIWI